MRPVCRWGRWPVPWLTMRCRATSLFVYPLDHGEQVSGLLNDPCLQEIGVLGPGHVLRPPERAIEHPANSIVLGPVQLALLAQSPDPEVQDDLVMICQVAQDCRQAATDQARPYAGPGLGPGSVRASRAAGGRSASGRCERHWRIYSIWDSHRGRITRTL